MAEGHGKDAWAHTSSLMALLANLNRDPKKKPKAFTPADFNPYQQRDTPDVTDKKAGFKALKSLFSGN